MKKVKCLLIAGAIVFSVLMIAAMRHVPAVSLVSVSAALTVIFGVCLSTLSLSWKRVASIILGKNKNDTKSVIDVQIGVTICSSVLGFILAMQNYHVAVYSPALATAVLPLLYSAAFCTYIKLVNTIEIEN